MLAVKALATTVCGDGVPVAKTDEITIIRANLNVEGVDVLSISTLWSLVKMRGLLTMGGAVRDLVLAHQHVHWSHCCKLLLSARW